MNSLMYRISYLLGMTRWDTNQVPPEVTQAFQSGTLPPGAALDLGCGTGTNVIYMAKQGRQSIGIDFVPQAIAKAKAKSQEAGVSTRTRFITADVTRIKELNLPQCVFALDMGCFHGLNPEGQLKYAQCLAEILIPEGRYLLYALEPHKDAGVTFGITAKRVKSVFSPWFHFDLIEPGSFWERKSNWFWMRRNSI